MLDVYVPSAPSVDRTVLSVNHNAIDPAANSQMPLKAVDTIGNYSK